MTLLAKNIFYYHTAKMGAAQSRWLQMESFGKTSLFRKSNSTN